MRAVNLIPAEERRGAGGIAGRSGGVVYVLPGGLAAVVVLGVVYAFAVHGVANRQEQLAAVTAQVTAVTAEAQELAPYVEFGSISAQQAQSTATLAQQRFDWPDAMEQLALALPSDVTISAFAALPASSSAAASTGGGPSFTLTGCASRQDEVATVLTDLAAVPGVTNVFVPTSAEIKRAKGKVSAKASEDTGGDRKSVV